MKAKNSFKDHATGQQNEISENSRLNVEKIRSHLLETVEETHRREVMEANAVKDMMDRKRLQEAAEKTNATRLAHIEDLANYFTEFEQSEHYIITSNDFRDMIGTSAYGETLAITKSLASGDPNSSEWQHDLSVSYRILGDIALTQGNLKKAASA